MLGLESAYFPGLPPGLFLPIMPPTRGPYAKPLRRRQVRARLHVRRAKARARRGHR